MTRLWSFILLLCLVPRLALAGASSGMICYTDDHVSVVCHAENDVDDCDSEPVPADDEQCIDVPTDHSPVRTNPALALADLMPAIAYLVPDVFVLTPPVPAQTGPVADAAPPAFSARAFCCSIALRC